MESALYSISMKAVKPKNQPMLDDGVVSSKVDMDIVAERRFIA
jgi:hypothetical protein